MVPAGAVPPALPPSVEEAYRRKCIELRKRQHEVEGNNDRLRERKLRLSRGIMKMRYERSVLLEALKKRMKKNGSDGPLGPNDDDSEDSSEAPPTPQERPLRTKKSHRRLPVSPPPAPSQLALTQPPTGTFSTPAAEPSASNGAVAGADSPSAAAPPASSPPNPSFPFVNSGGGGGGAAAAVVHPASQGKDVPPHPPTPAQMWTEHLKTSVLPSDPNLAAEIMDTWDNDVDRYATQEWRVMGEQEQGRWKARYEELMVEYEKAMDEKKRARREKRAVDSSGDVEMDE